MRFLAGVLLLLLISCSVPAQVSPHWIALNQGLGAHANVLALAATPENVFAAVYDRAGIYRAGTQFGAWTPDDLGMPPVPVFSLLDARGSLWAGTASGLFARSEGRQA